MHKILIRPRFFPALPGCRALGRGGFPLASARRAGSAGGSDGPSSPRVGGSGGSPQPLVPRARYSAAPPLLPARGDKGSGGAAGDFFRWCAGAHLRRAARWLRACGSGSQRNRDVDSADTLRPSHRLEPSGQRVADARQRGTRAARRNYHHGFCSCFRAAVSS